MFLKVVKLLDKQNVWFTVQTNLLINLEGGNSLTWFLS